MTRDAGDDETLPRPLRPSRAGTDPHLLPVPATDPMLPPQEVLAGRFRVVRFIAHGGMGRVYEAEDLRLGERVALKTLRPYLATSAVAQERFRREVQLARRVTHPNVCRIFDLGLHDGGEPVAFVTMELVSGETLADRLRRVGRLPFAEALPLVDQMCAGLAAAHEAGIVHRDFKTANVMLSPSEEGERAVITDFGLARSLREEDEAVTSRGAAVGTLAYMAPEQLSGETATPRTDLYALGIVMYEMAAGVHPFEGGPPISGAIRRLRERATSPREHAPELDGRWSKVILRCLEREPSRRFASARDVARALHGERVPGPRPPLHVALALGGALALGALGAVGAARWRTAEPAPAPSLLSRRAIAVMGFQNLSQGAEVAWLGAALTEMLTTELAVGEELRTVAGETVVRAKLDLGLADAPGFAPETLARIRSNTSADLVVVGSYLARPFASGGDIRLDVRLQDVKAGETVATISESGTEAELLGLVARVGSRLRTALGARARSESESRAATASLPTGPDAARLYGDGVARLRAMDTLAARDRLQEAVGADPRFALGWVGLAEAWDRLGYAAKAREAAARAFELSTPLAREQRLAVEGRYRETTGEWARAIEIYRALVAFFPDDLEYGLRLAAAQTAAGYGRDALSTTDALRALPSPSGDDPRVDLAEVEAAGSLGDYRRMQQAALRARAKGRARGSRLLLARARAAEAVAHRHLGDYPAAAAAAEEAQGIFAEAGDEDGKAWALDNLAGVLRSQGELAAARARNEEALGIFRRIGDQRGAAQALNSLAAVSVFQGQLGSARATWEEALAINREIGDRQHTAYQLVNLAGTDVELGRPRPARAAYEEALAICNEIGERALPRAIHYGLGNVSRDLGELPAARSSYAEARRISEERREKRFLAFALQGLAGVELAGDRLAESRRLQEEALALRTGLGEQLTSETSRVGLALVALEDGRAGDAEPLARQAAEVFAREGAAHDAAWARAVRALALVELGRVDEAEAALPSADRIEHVHARVAVTIARARVLLARRRGQHARSVVRPALAEVERLGLRGQALELRLLEAEATALVDAPAAAPLRARLAEQADQAGYALVARKARQAPGGRPVPTSGT
jgi:tetratricopeptide (TPR) repeat protein